MLIVRMVCVNSCGRVITRLGRGWLSLALLLLLFPAPSSLARADSPTCSTQTNSPNGQFSITQVSACPGGYYASEALTFNESTAITALDVVITVKTGDGTASWGSYCVMQVQGGTMQQKATDNGAAIVYDFHLPAGSKLVPDGNPTPSVLVAFNAAGSTHDYSQDTYFVAGVAGGQGFSKTGNFTVGNPLSFVNLPPVSTTSTVNAAVGGEYTEETIAMDVTKGLARFNVDLTIPTNGDGETAVNLWSTLPVSDSMLQSDSGNKLEFTWTYQEDKLQGMKYLPPGMYYLTAAFNPHKNSHTYACDTYNVTYTTNGVGGSTSGNFAAGDVPTPTATAIMTPTATMPATATSTPAATDSTTSTPTAPSVATDSATSAPTPTATDTPTFTPLAAGVVVSPPLLPKTPVATPYSKVHALKVIYASVKGPAKAGHVLQSNDRIKAMVLKMMAVKNPATLRKTVVQCKWIMRGRHRYYVPGNRYAKVHNWVCRAQ